MVERDAAAEMGIEDDGDLSVAALADLFPVAVPTIVGLVETLQDVESSLRNPVATAATGACGGLHSAASARRENVD